MVAAGVMVCFGLIGCVAEESESEEIGDMSQEGQGDCSVILTSLPADSATQGTSVELTGSATCPDGTPEYRFFARGPSSPWTQIRPYGTDPIFDWDTTGLEFGEWDLQVWTRRVGSGFNWEGATTISFDILEPPSCATVSFNPFTPPSPAFVGDAVDVSATADCTGGAVPEYRFWLRPPGGAWFEHQPYSTSDSFTWDTTGLAPGKWTLQVWSRYEGNPVVYEGYAQTTYRLNLDVGTCGSVTITNVAPPSPQSPGAMVDITASASCTTGATPEYEFWLRDPSSVWSLLRPYGSSDTATWDTTGAALGQYKLQVRARAQGAAVPFDSTTPTMNYRLQ
jgi:hypothetical protein